MSLEPFRFHIYPGGGQFTSREAGGVYRIENALSEGRATWMANWAGAVEAGQRYKIELEVRASGEASSGAPLLSSSGVWEGGVYNDNFPPSETFAAKSGVFVVPAGYTGFRLDLRLWNSKGWAEFRNVRVTLDSSPPDPGEEVPATPEILPIDNPEGGETFTVAWQAVAGAQVYSLVHSHNGGVFSEVYKGAATSYAVAGASTGTHSYRVAASNAAGSSALSTAVSTTVQGDAQPLAPPVLLPIQNGDDQPDFTVAWQPSQGASAYEIEHQHNGNPPEVLQTTEVSIAVTGAPPGQHLYRVRAVNEQGGVSGYSNRESTVVSEHNSSVVYYDQVFEPFLLDEQGVRWVSPLSLTLDPPDLVFTVEGQYRSAAFQILPSDQPAVIEVPTPQDTRYAGSILIRPQLGACSISVYIGARKLADITGGGVGKHWYNCWGYAEAAGDSFLVEVLPTAGDEHVLVEVSNVMLYQELATAQE